MHQAHWRRCGWAVWCVCVCVCVPQARTASSPADMRAAIRLASYVGWVCETMIVSRSDLVVSQYLYTRVHGQVLYDQLLSGR